MKKAEMTMTTLIAVIIIIVTVITIILVVPSRIKAGGGGLIDSTKDLINKGVSSVNLNFLNSFDVSAAQSESREFRTSEVSGPVSGNLNDYEPYAAQLSTKYPGLKSCQILAHIQTESSAAPTAIGSSGEIGLMQMMPQVAMYDYGVKVYDPDKRIATTPKSELWSSSFLSYLRGEYASDLRKLVSDNGGDVAKLKAYDIRFDPYANMQLGAEHLKRLKAELDRRTSSTNAYNSDKVIGAYNAGVGSVVKGNVPTEYVSRVNNYMSQIGCG